MPCSPLDRARLQDALALAETSFGLTEPNPRVGCVIGRADGSVLGRGATQQAGGAHAEVTALRDAATGGQPVQGATAWVTLEPCAHHGRTPPCCDALVAAGISRVVMALGDPFEHVNGAGAARLRAAGVVVDYADDDIARVARAVNIGFFSRVQRGRPWVRMKMAISLDGRTALPDGRSQWITGMAARTDGHAWRRRAGAVLTGVGTVLADDPRLDVRLVPTARQPLRVVVDSTLTTPATARLLAPPGETLIVTVGNDMAGHAALQAGGARVVTLPASNGRVDLPALIAHLAALSVNELHVEAGPTLNGGLLRAGLVDELLLYQAPVLLGAGRPLANLPPLAQLAEAQRYELMDTALVGGDLRLRLVLPSSAAFLRDGFVEKVDTQQQPCSAIPVSR